MSSNTFYYERFVRWVRKNNKHILIGFSAVALLLFLGYQVPMTGFKEDTEVTKSEEIINNGIKVTTIKRVIPAKKIWDWMDLLFVPTILAVLGIWYQRIQDQKETERKRDNQIEQEVNTYSENIAKLLTEHNLTNLIKERKKDELMDKGEFLERGLQAIRNKTILVLDQLGIDTEHEILLDQINDLLAKGENLSGQKDERRIKKIQDKLETTRNKLKFSVSKSRNSERKAAILRVLYKAELIKENYEQKREEQKPFLLDLKGADFRCANLDGLNLMHINLQGANLQGVNLDRAYLFYANLESPDSKSVTKFQGASLEGANLQSLNPDSDCITNLERVDLRGANLYKTNLQDVDLKGADLKFTKLEEAKLNGADFSARESGCSYAKTDLRYSTGLHKQQLTLANFDQAQLPSYLDEVDSNEGFSKKEKLKR